MTFSNLLLLAFPVLLLTMLIIGREKAGKDQFVQVFLPMTSANAIKGFAAVGIILHHLVQHDTQYGSIYKGPVFFMNEMGIFFTAIFFFLSGYGLLESYNSKPDYLDNFLKKRLPSVLVPFYLSNIIYIIIKGFLWERITNIKDFFTCLIGFTLLNTNTWFLVEITLLYLVFYFTYKHISNKKTALWTVFASILVMVTVGILLGHESDGIGGHWFKGEWWFNSTIAFYFGLSVGQYKDKILSFFKNRYKVMMPLTTVLFLISLNINYFGLQMIFGYYTESATSMGYPDKIASYIIQTISIIAFSAFFICLNLKLTFGNKLLFFFGKISLELYIIHGIFMEIFYYNLEFRGIALYLSVYATSIIAAWGLYFIDKPFIKLFKGK